MAFEDMVKQFKTDVELRAYAQAQFATIIELNKKIESLKERNAHLEAVLESSTPLLQEQKKDFLGVGVDKPNEEIISEVQLNKLKELSFERPLTLEESRRVEIFSKILLNIRNSRVGKKDEGASTIPTDNILELISKEDANG